MDFQSLDQWMLHAEFSNYPEKVNNKNGLSKFRPMQKS